MDGALEAWVLRGSGFEKGDKIRRVVWMLADDDPTTSASTRITKRDNNHHYPLDHLDR
jgi:hypothetical protein